MKVTVLEIVPVTNSKTGVISHEMTVLGDFSSYGTIKKSTVVVRLDLDQVPVMESFVNKEVDLDLIIPLPDFPLRLRETPKSTSSK